MSEKHLPQPVAQFWARLIQDFDLKVQARVEVSEEIAEREATKYKTDVAEARKKYHNPNVPPPRTAETIRKEMEDRIKGEIMTRLRDPAHPLFDRVEEKRRLEVAANFTASRMQGFTQKHIAEAVGAGKESIVSKVLTGRERHKDIEPFLAEYFSEVTTREQINKAYEFSPEIVEITMWKPRIGVLEWIPFSSERKGFLQQFAARFFQLSGLQDPRFEGKGFEALLYGKEKIELSLALAETIRRTSAVENFHTPAVMGMNLIGKFDSDTFERVRAILCHPDTTPLKTRIPVLTTPQEIADEYLRSLPGGGRHFQIAESAPPDQLSDNAWDNIEKGALYAADELTCLHVLEAGSKRKIGDLGLVLPLGTKQVVRHREYANLPSHKISVFSVPKYQRTICEFLREALRVYLQNQIENTAVLYKQLHRDLVNKVLDALKTLGAVPRDYLVALHERLDDDFYPGADRRTAIAERWARNTLRLYPEFLDEPLNLPWRPVLARALDLCGPISNEHRPPRERRAVMNYRELPPVIVRNAKDAKDYSVFGALLGPLRPHVVLDESVERYNRDDAQSQLGPETAAAVAIGFFAVSSRLFDWRFFRVPIRLRFSAVGYGGLSESQRAEVRSLLQILNDGQYSKIGELSIHVLLLKHGAAHNLLRDHGLSEKREMLVNDSKKDRAEAFIDQLRDVGRPAAVIADELTCLDVFGAGDGCELLGHGLNSAGLDASHSRGVYFSVAVRRSAPEWIQYFERALPLSTETYREAIAAAHADLFDRLDPWVRERTRRLRLPDRQIESWCRGVLTLDDPDTDILPGWHPVIELARERIRLRASGANA